jgi:hypothetical protein
MFNTFALLFCLTVCAPLLKCQDDNADNSFSPEQLDNLLAPVALYPDPLLAQVLVAATFPDQIDEAARFLRASSDPAGIDDQEWDISVKAVAHYPDALSMMADSLDWTTALGQAYTDQADDVMASIQRLRAQARDAGNLHSGPQQELVDDGGDIEIWPAQADDIYVPSYDPGVVYFGSGGALGSDIETFGSACNIGVWLNRDFDWRHRRIFYHGWDHGPQWVSRSRPHIQPSATYVDRHFQNITTGRAVRGRKLNYAALDRFATVHPDMTFRKPRAGQPAAANALGGNQIIQRNIDTNDPRLNSFRGDGDATSQRNRAERSPAVDRLGHEPDPQVPQPPMPQYRSPQVERPATPQPQPQTYRPPMPEHRSPQVERPAPQPPAPEHRQEPQPSHNEAFGGNREPFDAQAASQRGQASRSEMPRSEPRQAAPPPPHESAPRPRAPEPRDTGSQGRSTK